VLTGWFPFPTEPRLNERHHHPAFDAEQAFIDRAYGRLEVIRTEAVDRAAAHAAQRQTGFQAAYERDVAVQIASERAASLDIGDQSLVFGRIDHETDDLYYIGRRAVFDETYRPLVIDWRVPSAEPFYRATGLHPMGLAMRRHFQCEGRELLAIEDELFGEGSEISQAVSQVLIAELERPRTGHMRDIVATVQAEQDEIIRDELAGVLAVQGGPGTGKTAVGLHRAAYLLFTYRQKLQRQGILVVGPTYRFLRYIDQVLPALGEGGVELATLADLAPEVPVRDEDPESVARIKGDARMAELIARAVRSYQRAPNRDTTVLFEGFRISVSGREMRKLISIARRNRRSHNARRAMLLNILIQRIWRRYRTACKKKHGGLADELLVPRRQAGPMLREDPVLLAALESAWPLLTPQAVIGGLLSSRAALADAARGLLRDEDIELLARDDPDRWTTADVPLLDEALAHVGATVDRRRIVTLEVDETDELTVFGHIIVDEAQDLTPMALRMLARRSMTGSMTLVGDLAQAVGATPPRGWDEVLAMLPQSQGTRVRELTVNYRTPGVIMDVAARVLAEAAPDLKPPTSARLGGEPITFVQDDPARVVAELAAEHRAQGEGTLAVIAELRDVEALRIAAEAAPEDDQLAVLTVQEAKGLEFDRVVIVEPARIVASAAGGVRALYVSLTRATKHVTIVHTEPLPDVLVG